MNKKRQAEIQTCITQLESIKDSLDGILSDENDARAGMFEGTEMYEKSEDAIDALYEAKDGIDDIVDSLSNIV